MVKDEYEAWVECFAWTEAEKIEWLLNAIAHLERNSNANPICHSQESVESGL